MKHDLHLTVYTTDGPITEKKSLSQNELKDFLEGVNAKGMTFSTASMGTYYTSHSIIKIEVRAA